MSNVARVLGIYLLLPGLVIVMPGCPSGGTGLDGDDPPPSNLTYLWCAANKDAHITSQIPDASYGGGFSLVCAHGVPNGEQRTYVQFFIPQLPPGTQVLEAYINLFEDSDTGQTGNQGIHVGTANSDWVAATLTWNNQPNPAGPLSIAATIAPFDGVNTWRGTANINALVQDLVDGTVPNFGFVFDSSGAQAFTRSFRAMNALQARTQDTLGTGPRLLMRIQTEDPLDVNDIGTTVPPNGELGGMYGFGTDIRVFNRATDGWPAAWDVHTQ